MDFQLAMRMRRRFQSAYAYPLPPSALLYCNQRDAGSILDFEYSINFSRSIPREFLANWPASRRPLAFPSSRVKRIAFSSQNDTAKINASVLADNCGGRMLGVLREIRFRAYRLYTYVGEVMGEGVGSGAGWI